MTDSYNPQQHPLVRVIHARNRALIVIGQPGTKTFDVTPQEAIRLGLAIMETGLHEKSKRKGEIMSNRNDIEDRARVVITEHLGVFADKVVPEAKLADDLGADSLDKVELLMAFEHEFGIEIDDSDAEKVETVAQVHELVRGKVAHAA